MPSTATYPPAPRSPEARSGPTAGRAHRLLSVELDDSPGVLARILTVLLRRQCIVTRVDFVAPDRHRPGRLVLGYDAPAPHADRATDWLRALVDVLAVETLER